MATDSWAAEGERTVQEKQNPNCSPPLSLNVIQLIKLLICGRMLWLTGWVSQMMQMWSKKTLKPRLRAWPRCYLQGAHTYTSQLSSPTARCFVVRSCHVSIWDFQETQRLVIKPYLCDKTTTIWRFKSYIILQIHHEPCSPCLASIFPSMPAHSSPRQCCGLLYPRTWFVVTSCPFHLHALAFVSRGKKPTTQRETRCPSLSIS